MMLSDTRYLLSYLHADRSRSVNRGLDNECWEMRDDSYYYHMVITFTAGGVCWRVLQKQHQELIVCCQKRSTDSQVQTQEKRVSNDLCKSLAIEYVYMFNLITQLSMNTFIFLTANIFYVLLHLSNKWRRYNLNKIWKNYLQHENKNHQHNMYHGTMYQDQYV